MQVHKLLFLVHVSLHNKYLYTYMYVCCIVIHDMHLLYINMYSSFKAQLEKLAVLEKEKRQLKDRANSMEAQLVLKGRAVKEVEGRIEQVEEKHKKVGITNCIIHS